MVFQHRAQINVIYCVDFCFLDICSIHPNSFCVRLWGAISWWENIGIDIHWWLGGKTLYALDLQCPELFNCLCQITPMCLVSNITDVTIDIVSKNVIPNVCHWRIVAESKFDKNHLWTDKESTMRLPHSPQRELSKLSVLLKFSSAAHISCCVFLAKEIIDLNFLKILVNKGSYSKQV